jgi:hypothetical protein
VWWIPFYCLRVEPHDGARIGHVDALIPLFQEAARLRTAPSTRARPAAIIPR